jgi:hypothetical protein
MVRGEARTDSVANVAEEVRIRPHHQQLHRRVEQTDSTDREDEQGSLGEAAAKAENGRQQNRKNRENARARDDGDKLKQTVQRLPVPNVDGPTQRPVVDKSAAGFHRHQAKTEGACARDRSDEPTNARVT